MIHNYDINYEAAYAEDYSNNSMMKDKIEIQELGKMPFSLSIFIFHILDDITESDDFADNKTFYALSITSINELIPHISNVKTINELKVSHCDSLIKTDGISKLTNLRILDLSFNQLEEFNHTGLNNLVSLNLSCN